MLTRDQKYAVSAHKHVKRIHEQFGKVEAKSYGVMAHKLPILIHTAGLAQALAFVDARAKGDKKDDRKSNPQIMLLNDLAITIGKKNDQELLLAARESELVEYILLTRQIMNALLWYKRYAQSILDIDVGEIADEEDKTDAS